MDWTRAQGALKAAQLCLEQQLSDSAANRAYFAAFQAAICALETQGIKRDEWTHKGVHSDFVHRSSCDGEKSSRQALSPPSPT